MNIETEFKKDGITILEQLDSQSVSFIAEFIAQKLCCIFPNFKYNDIYEKALNVPMFIATLPEGIADANYFYKTSSIYFRDGMGLANLQKYALHEFIHHYQEVKDDSNILIHLGLCDLSEYKIHGIGLNEASVQLITSKALNETAETISYYEIDIPTKSPTYYPLLCNLVNQMAFITGESSLYKSTLLSDNDFKNDFMDLCGESTYCKIEDNLDSIFYLEEKINKLSFKLSDSKSIFSSFTNTSNNIKKYQNKIIKLFFETQDLIYSSYFNHYFKRITTLEELDIFTKKLDSYRELIGSNTTYTAFNEYYINMTQKVDEKCDFIHNNTSLISSSKNIFRTIYLKLKNLVSN